MDTICAISTAYGMGAIAVVRVSGSQAITICDTLFHGRDRLQDVPASSVRLGRIERDGEVLDEVLCSVFRAPHSFTGEDTVEIACHGSLFIQQELLHWLIDAGCRAAEPGEFTKRAFLNGKMDLTKAEAVADLIAARSRAEKDLALSQLRGSVSDTLTALSDRLLHFTSLIELELDFADHEELEFADRSQLIALADEIAHTLRTLLDSFKTGNAIRQGISVAIIGPPNVGKSTLLNALLGEQRAIVSDIQGTTRDTIEDTILIEGILFRFIDTAGIRDTTDTIEQMGIARSKRAAERANIILYLSDDGTWAPIEPLPGVVVPVLNKADLGVTGQGIAISAKQSQIQPLRDELVRIARSQLSPSAVMLSNARHYEAISRAYEAIVRVQEGLSLSLSGEILSLDLQDCLGALGEVTGRITNEQVLANIFNKFCIGK